jgi:DNA-binding HxlR family transcriptional regulator
MISEIDETCKILLLSLVDGPKDFADLQRAIQAGSSRTPRTHVKEHLAPLKLVNVKQKIKGRRKYYSIELTEKGRELCKRIKGG